MALTPDLREEVSSSPDEGLWRTVLGALDSNIKTVRLLLIILALARLAAAMH
jgi:hypothetical protein